MRKLSITLGSGSSGCSSAASTSGRCSSTALTSQGRGGGQLGRLDGRSFVPGSLAASAGQTLGSASCSAAETPLLGACSPAFGTGCVVEKQRRRRSQVITRARNRAAQEQEAAGSSDGSEFYAVPGRPGPIPDTYLLDDAEVLDADGKPQQYLVDATNLEEADVTAEPITTDEVIEQLHRLDALDRSRTALQRELDTREPAVRAAVEAADAEMADVPGSRVIRDPVELDLIGSGLPVIYGGEWPQVYWDALSELGKGRAIPMPKPHPKFSMQDLERIAGSGPRFGDVVLEHAERLTFSDDEDPLSAPSTGAAYKYVPSTVLGDWRFDQEPNWLQLPQENYYNFYHGLRQRNWTSKLYRPAAEPWQLQFFSCGYEGVTGWPGWRVVVTPARGGPAFWVDMPDAGATPLPHQQDVPEVGKMGYRHVLQQLYQAYEQRLPAAAQRELAVHGHITPGRYKYDCPGEDLLDVSYHFTPNTVTSPLANWLISPSIAGALTALKSGLADSGIFELKQLRDRIDFHFIPDLPRPHIDLDPAAAGPFYFLVCMVLGIVVPAIKRSKILDIRALEEDIGAAQEFARSKADARKEGLTGVEFADVAGLDPILNEVLEVVEFLKDPQSYSKLGARPPKGILLEGDPGTGKTLLAKALAGEAMAPFYQMSGTEFTEGIVGVGAGRIRDLFKRAAANAPCVIFVDELDAIGLKRAATGEIANEEREQTLNQLLTALDGFTPDAGVIFIGATNRADRLDPALLRPGRFDRKVHMPKPDTEGRYHILRLNLRGKQLEPDVDLQQLARDLPGLVGADLANVVNEAQLNAARDKRTVLSAKDLYAGVDRFTQGEKRPALPTSNKLPVLCFAAKEAGIALVAGRLRAQYGRVEMVERVSIQPKGRSLSRTFFARGTDEDYQVMTRGKLMDRIKLALAGSIAVRVVLGEETNFAAADIKRACRMAHKLVFYYSMSDLGITTWAKQPYAGDFFAGGSRPRKVVSTDAMDEYADWPTKQEDFRFDPMDPSDPTWHRYTDEVRRIIKGAYEEVWGFLQSHRSALWAGVQALSERREMLGGELRDVFDLHAPTPPDAHGMPPSPVADMQIFTKGRTQDRWPYGMEWLPDSVATPYWAEEQAKKDAEAASLALAGMAK